MTTYSAVESIERRLEVEFQPESIHLHQHLSHEEAEEDIVRFGFNAGHNRHNYRLQSLTGGDLWAGRETGRLPVAGCSKWTQYWVLGTGYWVLGTEYWVLGTEY